MRENPHCLKRLLLACCIFKKKLVKILLPLCLLHYFHDFSSLIAPQANYVRQGNHKKWSYKYECSKHIAMWYVDWKLSCDILVMDLKEFQFQVEVFSFQNIWIKLLLLTQFSSKLQKYYFEESWHNLPLSLNTQSCNSTGRWKL